MSEIAEKITNGLFITTSNEVATTEPITIAEVKDYMGITFTAHDTKLTRLITACREQLEKLKLVTLITSRNVAVTYNELYDWEDLPYSKVGTITATDLNNVTVTIEKADLGGFVRIKGDYENGLKLTYASLPITISQTIKEGLIRAVKECFEQGTTPIKAVLNEFKYISFK